MLLRRFLMLVDVLEKGGFWMKSGMSQLLPCVHLKMRCSHRRRRSRPQKLRKRLKRLQVLPKSRTDKGRSRNPKTHPRRAGRLTFKPPNSWQATCHRTNSHKHALGHTGTKCTRTRNFKSSAEEQIVLRQLRHWLNTAQDYGSRVAHMQAKAMPKADATRLGIDLELLLAKPPADYNSDPEGEEGIAIHDDSAEGPAGEAPASAASASASSSSSDSTSSSSGD